MINFIQKSFGINTQINTVDQDIAVLQNKLRDLELQLQKRESNNLKPAPIDFDQYIKKCYNKYIEIMDEIEQTQNQLQLQKNSRQDYEYKNNVQQRILQKEQKYKELQEEVKNLKQINTELKNNIKQKDFYREYDLMCKEMEGLIRQNKNLQDKIASIS